MVTALSQVNTKQSGFTFIEVTVVLILLGILGSVAFARFSDLESETRVPLIKGLESSIRATVAVQHAIVQTSTSPRRFDNGFIANGVLFDQGYPVALDYDVPNSPFNSGDGTPEILEAMDLDLDDWTFSTIIRGSENGQRTRELYITSKSVLASARNARQITDTACYVSYDSYLRVRIAPVIRTVTSGC